MFFIMVSFGLAVLTCFSTSVKSDLTIREDLDGEEVRGKTSEKGTQNSNLQMNEEQKSQITKSLMENLCSRGKEE